MRTLPVQHFARAAYRMRRRRLQATPTLVMHMAMDTTKEVSLDVLYSPSCWSSRLSDDLIVDNHIQVLHEGTALATLD